MKPQSPECPAGQLQVTEGAQRKATTAREQAAQAAEAVRQGTEDTLNQGQAQGESAWQKAKDVVTHAYEQVIFSAVVGRVHYARLCLNMEFDHAG